MPGQRNRRRKQEEELRRQSEARAAAGAAAGPWEVLFSTEDHREFRAFVHRLYASGDLPTDAEVVHDMLCGRLVHPTVYRLRMRRPNVQG
ncbi:hypothetical protein AB0C76_09095 [Kitasatospora sp. NPDC048722]|uniref:hypothetical protein n=1 Tax=Kitasatospora sp. NPDC048722 TaxID=3155639 RepID=UPI00340C1DC8